MRHTYCCAIALLFALAESPVPSAAAIQASGFGAFQSDAVRCVDPAAMPKRPPTESAMLFPLYDWPLDRQLRDGFILVNYIDHDPGPGIGDYTGGSWAYDGHNGTDITLHDFRSMDRGAKVLSGAPGTVFYTTFDKVDRNTGPPFPDTENNVLVDNGDGTTTWYLHFRRNSVTVQPGDVVARGTVLGLVGSSGFSTDAHLHFEVGQYGPSTWTPRDPWNGPFNPLPSLWSVQKPYVGSDPLWVADMGAFTPAAVGGNLNSFPFGLFKERISQPAVLGANEPFIPIWLQLQGRAGDAYRLEIRRPDASLYAFVDYTLPGDFRYGWHYWYWNWGPGLVPPSTYGTWSARVLVNAVENRRVTFQVGAATAFGPRLAPIAGRSFRVSGAVQRDTLRVSPLGGPVSFALSAAPAGVSLADSILTIPASSTQLSRSAYFSVFATDGAGRRDTASFHLVDMSKPLEPPVGAVSGEPEPGGVRLTGVGPNPFRGSTRIAYVLPKATRVDLAVFDVTGRRVSTLEAGVREAGTHAVRWNGVDAAGRRLAAGVYRFRLMAGGEERSRNVVLLD